MSSQIFTPEVRRRIVLSAPFIIAAIMATFSFDVTDGVYDSVGGVPLEIPSDLPEGMTREDYIAQISMGQWTVAMLSAGFGLGLLAAGRRR